MAINALYRFTLNNGSDTILNDEPLNWNESKIQVERDNVIKGLFVQYITELQFVGDGYTYLLNEVNAQGICGTVDIKIEYRLDFNQSFETLFNGVIYLKDISENVQKQIISVDVQDANFSRLIRDRKDFKVNTAADSSINDESITAPTSKQVKLHRTQVDSYGTYQNTVRAYSVFDLFKLVIEYITDDQVVFESDFFSGSGSRPETWNLNIVGAITAKTYTLEIVNEFGTYTGTYAASGGETVEQVVSLCLNNTITGDNSKSPTGYKYDGIPPYNGVGSTIGSFYDGTTWQAPYCIQSLWPISSMTLTDGTCSKIQELEHNMGELHVSYGRMIFDMVDTGANSSDVEFFYSFNDLFSSLNQKFDLTFEMYDNGGIPTCKIETTKDFFNSATSATVSLDNVNNISKEFTLAYKKASISLTPEQVTLQTDLITQNIGSGELWSDVDIDAKADFTIVNDCGEDKIDSSSPILYQTKAFNKLFFDKVDDNGTPRPPDIYNERLFLVDIYESGGNYYSKQYQYMRGIFGAASIIYYYIGYNFFLSTFKNVYYWMFSLGNTAKMTRLEIANDNALQFDIIYTFDYPISKVDWSSILNNLTNKITISGQGLDSTDVWIESIEIDPYKGMANFSVVSSS